MERTESENSVIPSAARDLTGWLELGSSRSLAALGMTPWVVAASAHHSHHLSALRPLRPSVLSVYLSPPCRLPKPSASRSRPSGATKLRSFFTLLGIIVSVGFLVVVVAIIQGMNAYVQGERDRGHDRDERLPGATDRRSPSG